MPFKIPLLNMEPREVKVYIDTKLENPKVQKNCVLFIVSVALLLDNMLYMVIVPIIPEFFRDTGVYKKGNCEKYFKHKVDQFNNTMCKKWDYEGEDTMNGHLFASKAAIQILINPISGTIIDRIGYELPMIIGLSIMFVSTMMFSVGSSYAMLFFARALQGVGSAFADTSGLAMIADRFQDEQERSKALGIALAFISFGSLIAPPFGGWLYEGFGKEKSIPFLVLALVCLMDAFLVWYIIRPKINRPVVIAHDGNVQHGTPIWRLLMDPMIAVTAGALVMANVSLAFIEPTITTWMEDKTDWDIDASEAGAVWLWAFPPHVFGVYLTIMLMRRYPMYPWLFAAVGLAIEGCACLLLPFSPNYYAVILPLCIVCFGVALIDTSLLPMLGYLVDTRHVSVYGSVYAIADMSYSLAYALGPEIAGRIKGTYGFTTLNIIIFVSNLAYVPMLMYLKKVYNYEQFAEESAARAERIGDGDEEEEGEYEKISAPQKHEYGRAAYGAMADTETQAMAKQGYGYGEDNVKESFGVPASIADKFK